jgi:hypothetical protein
MNCRIFFASFTALTLLGGCSTVVNGRYQSVQLTTVCGQTTVPAQCTLTNEHGEWKTRTPNQVIVQRGFGDLDITCESPNFEVHRMRVKSLTAPATLLNALNLNTLTVVDVGNGSGFEYPKQIKFNVEQCHFAR